MDLAPVKRRKITNWDPESDSDSDSSNESHHNNSSGKIQNLYLETINRSRLDFDFDKICSVSLSNVNVYACLVCGKYLQGRGKSSYAFAHSISQDHHIYVNLSTRKFYILPENYEVTDTRTLDDIKYQIAPHFHRNDVLSLHKRQAAAHDLNGLEYRPGFIGINNANDTNDYANVVIQLLAHVDMLRDILLLRDIHPDDSELVQRFCLVVKKLWSSRLFKSHISIHSLLQHIYESSSKFSHEHKSDPKTFLLWLLNKLAQDLAPSKGKKSVINKVFQGKLSLDSGDSTKFWLLSLDLPHYSLLKEGEGTGNEIPQVSLTQLLLDKYSKRVKSLPQVLILHLNRFQNANMNIASVSGSERNPTVVKFSTEMDLSGLLEQNEVVPVTYRLISNVVHELVPLKSLENKDRDSNNWKIQVLDKVRDDWLLIHDLKVDEVQKELLFLEESYIQMWERVER